MNGSRLNCIVRTVYNVCYGITGSCDVVGAFDLEDALSTDPIISWRPGSAPDDETLTDKLC